MKKFCEPLKEHVMEKVIWKRKKRKLLIDEQQTSCENAKKLIYFFKKVEDNMLKIIIIVKIGTIVVIHGNIEALHTTYLIESKLYLTKFS